MEGLHIVCVVCAERIWENAGMATDWKVPREQQCGRKKK
jgi:hypothetical protein